MPAMARAESLTSERNVSFTKDNKLVADFRPTRLPLFSPPTVSLVNRTSCTPFGSV